eukprot:1792899-Amphidinium_carterae.2
MAPPCVVRIISVTYGSHAQEPVADFPSPAGALCKVTQKLKVKLPKTKEFDMPYPEPFRTALSYSS